MGSSPVAAINTSVVDNMLDNLSSNDELNIFINRESQTPITNTLETPAQKKKKFLNNRS